MSNKAELLIEGIEGLYESSNPLNELMPRRMVSFRGGKRRLRRKCPPGFKLDATGKTCVKMSSREVMMRRRAAKKAARKRVGKTALIARKRKLTMQKRKASGVK